MCYNKKLTVISSCEMDKHMFKKSLLLFTALCSFFIFIELSNLFKTIYPIFIDALINNNPSFSEFSIAITAIVIIKFLTFHYLKTAKILLKI